MDSLEALYGKDLNGWEIRDFHMPVCRQTGNDFVSLAECDGMPVIVLKQSLLSTITPRLAISNIGPVYIHSVCILNKEKRLAFAIGEAGGLWNKPLRVIFDNDPKDKLVWGPLRADDFFWENI